MSSDGAFPALLEFAALLAVPQAVARIRLHRLQAREPRAALPDAAWRRSAARSYGDYLDYLEVHPDEYEVLFDSLLINVTEFFRDPPVWSHLQAEVLPQILAAKPPDEPIRVWSAGCATGQEAMHRRHAAVRGCSARRSTASA